MDLSRLSGVRPEDLERVERYKRAYAILEETAHAPEIGKAIVDSIM